MATALNTEGRTITTQVLLGQNISSYLGKTSVREGRQTVGTQLAGDPAKHAEQRRTSAVAEEKRAGTVGER